MRAGRSEGVNSMVRGDAEPLDVNKKNVIFWKRRGR